MDRNDKVAADKNEVNVFDQEAEPDTIEGELSEVQLNDVSGGGAGKVKPIAPVSTDATVSGSLVDKPYTNTSE